MKKLLVCLAVFVSVNAFSQDKILFKDKTDTTYCKIKSVNASNIFYIEKGEHKSDYVRNVAYHSDVTPTVPNNKIIAYKERKVKKSSEIVAGDNMFTILYIANMPEAPYGTGVFVHLKKNSFFTSFTFGSSETGTSIDAHENTGVYQIGTWGNIATGNKSSYTYNEFTHWDIGYGRKIYQKNKFSFRPYVGMGLTFYNSETQNYVQAEDVTSGFNVLGYYWVYNGRTSKANNKFNFHLGGLLESGMISFGMGFESEPNGLTLLLGFNF